MYRKILCVWFLDDSAHAPIRLDAPDFVEEALKCVGFIGDGTMFEERLASEWIYRRRWSYVARFGLLPEGRRVFINVSRLRGRWSIYINNVLCAEGTDGSAEFEATGRFTGEDEMRICFEAPDGSELRPVFGFAGAAMVRYTGPCAVTELDSGVDETGKTYLYARVDTTGNQKIELKLRAESPAGVREVSYRGEVNRLANLHIGIDPLPCGQSCELHAQLYTGGTLGDELVTYTVPADTSIARRGFIGDGGDVCAACKNAGGNTVFTRDAKADSFCRLLAARHALTALPVGCRDAETAPKALSKAERLLEIAGSEKELEKSVLWALTQSDKGAYDGVKALMPGAGLEEIAVFSRVRQALDVRKLAFEKRLENRDLVLDNVSADYEKPASASLFDAPGQPRPAYFALAGAWKKRACFAVVPETVPEDGIFTCRVYCLSDDRNSVPCTVKAELFGEDGALLYTTAYSCYTNSGLAGSFTAELTGERGFIRCTLTAEGEECVSDTAVSKKTLLPGELLPTQLLADNGKITNVGRTVAFYVCIPAGEFFGCLLPGQSVTADRGNSDTAEGLNSFI